IYTLSLHDALPIYSGNRYIKTYPATAENAAWGDAYKAKYNEYPTNWSWENATAVMLIAEASRKANSADGRRLADAMRGLTIKSLFGDLRVRPRIASASFLPSA